jgi:signal transduction histidine kinase
MFSLWLVLLITGGWAGGVCAQAQGKAIATLDTDGRGFTFEIPQIMTFKGSFSAMLVRGAQTRELLSTMGMPEFQPGRTQVLHSAEGVLLSGTDFFTEETPCGRATGKEVALRFHRLQLDLLVRLSQVKGLSGFQVQLGIRNSGPSPVRLLSLTPVVMEGRVEGKPEEWLVTALDASVKYNPAVVALNEIQNSFNVFEYGGFYRGDGNGFLFGPVGTPAAYVEASIAHKGNGKVAFTLAAEMSGVQVKPGETRWGQQVALFAESPRTALPRWAGWVAKTHGARTDKGALSGWNSWQFHATKITGKDLLQEVGVVVKNPERLRPEVMQIDGGYRDANNYNRESNDYFPEGLAFYARHITATGARPGILLNFTGPPGWSNIVGDICHAVRSGYTYLKINRTDLSIPPEDLIGKTLFEAKRQGFAAVRAAAGADTYLLYNDAHPDRASVGLVDANRTGVTAERGFVRRAMTDVLRSYQLNNRWFAVDNDSYYMGTDIANVSEIEGGWSMVRTWMSMVGLSCGAAFTADPWHMESFQPYWRNVEVMTPPAKEQTEVLDLCMRNEWPRLVGHVKRGWGEQTVALLWNPSKKEQAVTLDFVQAGLDIRRRYAVWSFWDNRYLGVAKGVWTTPALGASDSQHLCFTDLDSTPGKPVLIGSSFHIYCGAAEIKQVKSSRGAMAIEFTDAGARDGDLFIYSRLPVIPKTVVGCAVTGVAPAGENAWRISIAGRKCGVPQRIDLNVLLPMTQQIWFWVLIGAVLLSLLLSAWRYLTVLRLKREHALDRERGRIARDIHDDLGTSLTRISVLAENATTEPCELSQVKEDVRSVWAIAQEMTRAMDEIVWAINPSHDSLDSLATYFGSYTALVAKEAGLRCRLDFPLTLPEWKLSAEKRHHLFLAFKEAVGNVLKHAHATELKVGLTATPEKVELFIEDNGQGVPDGLHAAGSQNGNGLVNMRHRMTQMNGSFHIDSPAGGGTRITFAVPATALKV